jgi:hypothetical protein
MLKHRWVTSQPIDCCIFLARPDHNRVVRPLTNRRTVYAIAIMGVSIQ